MKIKMLKVIFLLSALTIFPACNSRVENPTQNSNKKESSASANDFEDKNSNSLESTKVSEAKSEISPPPSKLDEQQRQETIDKYIAGVAKVSDADEYKEARKVFYGDLDGDGDEDAAAQFTVEGMGGGNMYSYYLAVFRNENGNFSGFTDEVIGGKLNRDITFTKIEDGKMYFDTKGYAENDGACCPSILGKTIYILKGNKITEIKPNKEK